MLVTGKFSAFTLMIVCSALILFWIRRATTVKPPVIRRIPALDAIVEGVGRAAEMGQPVLWSPGQVGSMTSSRAGPILTSIAMLEYIADHCIKNGVKIVCLVQGAEDLAFVTQLLREKYRAAGVEDLFDISDLIYAPKDAYHMAAVNTIQIKKPATIFWMGQFSSSAAIVAEAGAVSGAFQSAWTVDLANTSYFVMSSNYVMISEEGYTAAAYLSEDPLLQGSIAGQDLAKYFMLLIIAIGTILRTLNIPLIVDLLGM